MEIVQPSGSGSSGSPLTVTDGVTSVLNVTTIDFNTGATVTDGGGGNAIVDVTGGAGAVDSVNGQTGVVVLDTGDIAEVTDANYVSDAQLVVLGNTSGTNTGDNATNTQYSGLAASKQDTLVSGTNIKTVNGTTLLGAGDLTTPQGTVTAVSVTSANGVSGSSSGGATPALTIALGAITPTTVNSVTISGSSTPTLSVTGTSSISGSNTGDQTGGTPAITLGTTNTAGSSPNFLRRDDTILAFDATSPSTQAYGDAAVVGVATVAARRDHKHAFPASTKDTTAITGILKGNGTVVSAAVNSDLPTMTATVGGAVPTPPNNTTTFLRGDGTFAAPTASATITTQEEGVTLSSTVTTLNFTGAGVTASGAGATTTIDIPGGGVGGGISLGLAMMASRAYLRM